MKTSLKTLLRIGSLILAATILPVRAMPPLPVQVDPSKLPPHPRLFAPAARFDSLKAQRDPVSLQLMELLRADAEKKLALPAVVYPDKGTMLFATRDVQGRVLTLAMMYRLTGERRYFERARQELLQLAARPEWGVGHFLDAAEAALAAAVGLDWLHDELLPEERDRIGRAIVDRALVPSLEAEEGKNGWVDGDYNWNQVCNAGLSAGALVVAEREPELARRIVERAVRNVPRAGATYAPDGSYPEGPSYWNYGTTFHIYLVEMLRSALGTSAGLEALPGFLESSDYRLQMVAPGGVPFNYADYHNENHNEPLMLWFARERNRPDLADAELRDVSRMADTLHRPDAPGKRLAISRNLALELLWWNPALPESKGSSLPLHWTAGGHLPLAVMRSAWNDPRATYLAIKGGTPDGSHAHMDVGSFVLEADGVRWALDLGTENYDRMRAAKIDLWNYTQDSSRWTVFRNGPEGHNLPRFNAARQNVAGHAEIRALPPGEGGGVGDVVELSPLYRGQVENVRRQVRLLPDRSVAIEDEWTTGAQPVDYAFQWLTTAKVTVRAGGSLRLEQAGEALELRVESPDAFQVETEDVSQPRGPQDSPNPGLSRILIRQKTVANRTGRLKVMAIPGSLPPPTPTAVSTPARRPRILLCSAWQIVNIGDIAHTPSALALIAEHFPEAEVTLWPFRPLTPAATALLLGRFPDLKIISGNVPAEGETPSPELAAAFDEADFFVHASGPATLGWAHAEAFHRHTGRPFGVYGVTYGLYGIPEKATLSRARFAYFRDSVSLAAALADGVHAPITEWSPDVAFATDLRDDARADAYLRANGLEDGQFLCCISRLRHTPFWTMSAHAGVPFDPVKHARNEAMKTHDHAPLIEAIIAVARQTPMKILVCPEDETQVLNNRDNLMAHLPEDVRARVVWRDTFWLPDEALSVYRRSAGLFASEMHSPIMCVGNGVPAIVCRWAEQSTKGIMWRDIGLGEWLFDFDDEADLPRVAPAVLAIARDPAAARAKAEQARERVRARFRETMAVVRREVMLAAASRAL